MLSAYIPNYEVAEAFQMALKTGCWKEIAKAVSICDELLMATIAGKADRVAELVELAHDTYTSVLKEWRNFLFSGKQLHCFSRH